jgi:hypothetical protein
MLHYSLFLDFCYFVQKIVTHFCLYISGGYVLNISHCNQNYSHLSVTGSIVGACE